MNPECYEKVWKQPIEIGEEIFTEEQKYKTCYSKDWKECNKSMDCMFEKLQKYNQRYLYEI
jgi:hypothetical protein